MMTVITSPKSHAQVPILATSMRLASGILFFGAACISLIASGLLGQSGPAAVVGVIAACAIPVAAGWIAGDWGILLLPTPLLFVAALWAGDDPIDVLGLPSGAVVALFVVVPMVALLAAGVAASHWPARH